MVGLEINGRKAFRNYKNFAEFLENGLPFITYLPFNHALPYITCKEDHGALWREVAI